jgi:2,3-bisphosphoglycerate-dependent phosphoglycerate mutase
MTNSTEIVLVRHAETTMISDNRIHGQLDAALTEGGIAAALKTAEILGGQKFDAFYASSLGRALRKAEIIGNAINIQPVPVDGLRERNYGWLEGKPLAIFEPDLTGPAFMYPVIKFSLHVSGERDGEFSSRIVKNVEEIIQRHICQRVQLVIHWRILSIMTRYFKSESMEGWQSVGPWIACRISEFRKNGMGWQTIRSDDHSHL